MAQDSSNQHSGLQRITRLTPLDTVLALIAVQVGAVAPRSAALAAAAGATLAEDVAVSELPPQPIAVQDGYAVEAAAIADASSYAPVWLASVPRRVDAGEPMPPGTDAVAPLDAVEPRDGGAEAIAAVAPGQGVLPAGGDATPQQPLRRAGERLRTQDIAVLAAAGVSQVTIRSPRLRIASGGAVKTAPIEAALAMLAELVVKAGGTIAAEAPSFREALADDHADAVIAVGGTGSGRNDTSVLSLARLGRVAAHGIGVSPGETAAFGFSGARPVLLIPGRLDAVLAVWLLIGRPLIARLAGGTMQDAGMAMPLRRKVASAIGLTELVPVKCTGGMADPLGSGYLSFAALTASDGFVVVPADSEGFPAGAHVAVRPWP